MELENQIILIIPEWFYYLIGIYLVVDLIKTIFNIIIKCRKNHL
jgi:hypothetical protein